MDVHAGDDGDRARQVEAVRAVAGEHRAAADVQRPVAGQDSGLPVLVQVAARDGDHAAGAGHDAARRPVFWSSVEPVRVAVPPETETPLSVFELAVRLEAISVPAVSATPNDAPLVAPFPCDVTDGELMGAGRCRAGCRRHRCRRPRCWSRSASPCRSEIPGKLPPVPFPEAVELERFSGGVPEDVGGRTTPNSTVSVGVQAGRRHRAALERRPPSAALTVVLPVMLTVTPAAHGTLTPAAGHVHVTFSAWRRRRPPRSMPSVDRAVADAARACREQGLPVLRRR